MRILTKERLHVNTLWFSSTKDLVSQCRFDSGLKLYLRATIIVHVSRLDI